jgi:AcrR family transcriptional regulator
VSELDALGPFPRRRRADAERNVNTILDAATKLLGRRPEAGMDEIAADAGVSRQTIYAHFGSRQGLLDLVAERAVSKVVAAMDALDLDQGTAADALRRWLETAWRLLARDPGLLLPAATPDREESRYERVTGPLLALIQRGKDSGEFDSRFPAEWLLLATAVLGHAAGEEVAAHRMTARDAGRAFTTGVLRVFGVDADGSDTNPTST